MQDVLLYQLPEHAEFFVELLNALHDGGTGSGHATVTVAFSKSDLLRLERIVGSARAKAMLKGANRTFLFC